MSSVRITQRLDLDEIVSYHQDGDYVTVDVHLQPASELYGKVLSTGPDGFLFGFVRLGPASVYTEPELAERIGKVLAEWKAEQETTVQRINREHMARLRADAQSDDGARVARAHADMAVLQDYDKAKGRV